MGYKTSIRTYKIEFAEGHEFHGAEARVRGMTFAEYLRATGMDGGDGEDSAATVKRFVTHLVSWNLEDEDGPIPATEEGVNRVDHDLVLAINNSWIKTLMGVADTDPLPDNSPSGEPSPVESIPTEALSQSLAS
ncbi:hypothetical protein [Streptomyces fumanus]|uniref:Uncharacterized protein n=1 Tax=Streptomyces fumanus TaxID=67302 RepID=A0A919A2Y0_9ACTN|nr:hypothetical protein [Streptomyces fumanus]GHE85103.1 hypothetical protein GCM10018772_05330 [Streptomyces fumanus]